MFALISFPKRKGKEKKKDKHITAWIPAHPRKLAVSFLIQVQGEDKIWVSGIKHISNGMERQSLITSHHFSHSFAPSTANPCAIFFHNV